MQASSDKPADRAAPLVKKIQVEAVLRLVILWKIAKGVLFGIVAVGLVLPGDGALFLLGRLAHRLAHSAHYLQPLGLFIETHTTPATIASTALLSGAVAVLVSVEAIGLHFRRRWALWLTVIATSALIPIELYQLFHKVRAGALVVVAVNLFIVLYLVRVARRYTSMWRS